MCTPYERSAFLVFSTLDPQQPKPIKVIAEALGPDLFLLALDGQTLPRYLQNLSRDKYVVRADGGFCLTDKGQRRLELLRELANAG